MKTTFNLDKQKIKLARQIETVKSQINKYIKRERKKQLPEGVHYWDFDCKFGLTKEDAQAVHLTAITKHIDEAEKQDTRSFYIEIIAKEGIRLSKESRE